MAAFIVRVFLSAILFSGASAYAEKVLVVGDSLSCEGVYGIVGFGMTLARNLSLSGDEVTLYCMESSTPQHWISGTRARGGRGCLKAVTPALRSQPCRPDGSPPAFNEILNSFAGNKVIVALGTNSLASGYANGAYVDMAAAIRRRGKVCEWIGPPAMNTRYGRPQSQQLQNNLPRFYASLIKPNRDAEPRPYVSDYCSKITDSRGVTSTGPGNDTDRGAAGNDGIHRSARAGVYWANQIYPPVIVRKKNPAPPTPGAN